MFEFNNVKYLDILDIANLKIEDNKITCITGPSGSGKTTTLKLLNKIISPTSGEVLFNGEDLSKIDSVAHRRMIPMLDQSPLIFVGNIRDNLQMGRKFQELSDLDDEILKEALKKVELNKSLDENIKNLSGGEQQRVSIARLMLLDAKYYLLDEPSSALDDITEEFVIGTIVDMARKNNKTVIYVTHSDAISKKFSDTIIEIVKGRVIDE